MGCGAGRGDRCEISRSQKRLTGADSCAEASRLKAGARRFVGSKTRGRFDVVATAGTRLAFGGDLGAGGSRSMSHKKRKEKEREKRTDACAVQCRAVSAAVHSLTSQSNHLQDAKGVDQTLSYSKTFLKIHAAYIAQEIYFVVHPAHINVVGIWWHRMRVCGWRDGALAG